MAYTVPKLTDFSASALDTAMRELLSALDQASIAVDSENDWKALPRSLDGAEERNSHATQ